MHSVSLLLVKTACLGRIWCLGYGTKRGSPTPLRLFFSIFFLIVDFRYIISFIFHSRSCTSCTQYLWLWIWLTSIFFTFFIILFFFSLKAWVHLINPLFYFIQGKVSSTICAKLHWFKNPMSSKYCHIWKIP